jgi:hypothetical protein
MAVEPRSVSTQRSAQIGTRVAHAVALLDVPWVVAERPGKHGLRGHLEVVAQEIATVVVARTLMRRRLGPVWQDLRLVAAHRTARECQPPGSAGTG